MGQKQPQIPNGEAVLYGPDGRPVLTISHGADTFVLATHDLVGHDLMRQLLSEIRLLRAHVETITGERITLQDLEDL